MQENDFLNIENELISTKNIRIGNGPTLDEKIDFIYKELKSQKRNSRIKLFIKIFIIAIIYYTIFVYLPTLPQEKTDNYKKIATDFISNRVSTIAMPIVQDMTSKMVNDMSKGSVGIDKNTINEVLNSNGDETKSKIEDFLKKHPELKDKISK